MNCPNCKSSYIRRSKRNDAEKYLLPLVFLRPFRCEDCILRFYGWMWSEGSTAPERAKSDLTRTPVPTAALHSFRRHSLRRKIENKLGVNPWELVSRSVLSWLKKPRQTPVAATAPQFSPEAMLPLEPVSNVSANLQAPFQPEILGVITEIKHDETEN